MVAEVVSQMQSFYQSIASDGRISATHISVYMALLYRWNGDNRTPLELRRQDVMRTAKISARQTYNKCMNDLKQYGYIRYIPSTGPGIESLVYLNVLKKMQV